MVRVSVKAHELKRRESIGAESVSDDSRRFFPLLPLLLAGSGCAALIYEIVWLQLLQLVIGSSAVSLGLLLAAYMGGLCLGSAALPRVVSRRHHPLLVYALLELGIGILGLAALFVVPLVGRIYVAGATEGMAGLVLRGLVAAVCLLPPTLLMGGSLPAIARWIETTPKGVSWLGYLYSSNIAGAVFGCVFAGFYLLRVYDMAVATYVAAAINLVVAGLSFALARRASDAAEPEAVTAVSAQRAPGALLVYIAIALSGLCALGAEVVWTRLLSLLLGATVYTFSIILAVFLMGLWAGSTAGSFLSRRVTHSRIALAGCQILLAIAIAWTAYTMAHSLPFWPVDPWLSLNPWFNFEIDLMRCIWAIFPATLLWGASFPLALAAVGSTGPGSGETLRRNLRRQHGGFDTWCSRFQSDFDSGAGNEWVATAFDRTLRCRCCDCRLIRSRCSLAQSRPHRSDRHSDGGARMRVGMERCGRSLGGDRLRTPHSPHRAGAPT